MASSLTVTEFCNEGSKYKTYGTGNLGTYAANGIAVTARQCGLGTIDNLRIYPAGGYVFEYDKTNGKVKAFFGNAHQHTFTVQASGAIGANMEIGISADATSATVQGGTGVTAARTLAVANSPVDANTAAVLDEVGAVSLAAVTFRWEAFGT